MEDALGNYSPHPIAALTNRRLLLTQDKLWFTKLVFPMTSITSRSDLYFAAEDAVDHEAVGQNEGYSDGDDDEEYLERELRGCCIVDR